MKFMLSLLIVMFSTQLSFAAEPEEAPFQPTPEMLLLQGNLKGTWRKQGSLVQFIIEIETAKGKKDELAAISARESKDFKTTGKYVQLTRLNREVLPDLRKEFPYNYDQIEYLAPQSVFGGLRGVWLSLNKDGSDPKFVSDGVVVWESNAWIKGFEPSEDSKLTRKLELQNKK